MIVNIFKNVTPKLVGWPLGALRIETSTDSVPSVAPVSALHDGRRGAPGIFGGNDSVAFRVRVELRHLLLVFGQAPGIERVDRLLANSRPRSGMKKADGPDDVALEFGGSVVPIAALVGVVRLANFEFVRASVVVAFVLPDSSVMA